MTYIFLANGFEEIEAITTIDILRRCDIDIKTVGIGSKTVTGAHDMSVNCDLSDNEISLDDDISAIILPGGMPGTLNLEKSGIVNKFIDFAIDKNILICAICAAPTILGHKGLLDGKSACVFPGFEKDLGSACINNDAVSKCGNIITSRAAGTAKDFAFTIAKELTCDEKVDSVRKSMLW